MGSVLAANLGEGAVNLLETSQLDRVVLGFREINHILLF